MELADLDTQRFSIGKAAVFYAAAAWDWASDLSANLLFLGFTEGEVTLPFNETFNALTLPEYTGDAQHKAYVQGEAPVVTLPLYVADPALRAILSPSGNASGGYRRQRPVVERTLALIPEELFIDPSDPEAQAELILAATGSEWTLGGVALTADQEAQFGQSAWLWRGYFRKPQMRYVHEDGGKVVEPVEFVVMQQNAAPNGHRLYTLGDPYEAGIDVTTGVLES